MSLFVENILNAHCLVACGSHVLLLAMKETSLLEDSYEIKEQNEGIWS